MVQHKAILDHKSATRAVGSDLVISIGFSPPTCPVVLWDFAQDAMFAEVHFLGSSGSSVLC